MKNLVDVGIIAIMVAVCASCVALVATSECRVAVTACSVVKAVFIVLFLLTTLFCVSRIWVLNRRGK